MLSFENNSISQEAVVIRSATASDAPALERLADLDSARVPSGAVLIAELRGQPVAAVPLDGGIAIADPFVPSAHLVELLRLRARQVDPDSGAEEDGRLGRWAAASRESIGDTRDRLHRLLQRPHVSV